MALNLFANFDEFSSNDLNYSFGGLGDNNEDVIELPEEFNRKTVNKPNRRQGKAKLNSVLENKLECPDLGTSDKDVTVNPGFGQKTAFEKLSKLKQSLANTAAIEPTKKRSRSSVNAAIREVFQQKRTKRARTAEIVEPQLYHTSAVFQSNTVNDLFEDEELSVYIKIKWEGTSKIERIQFNMYKSFTELVDELSKREKIDATSFLLMFGNHVIKPEDSPQSIGYTLGKFISVRVVENPNLYITESTLSTKGNNIEVKIQSPQWKKPMICTIKLSDQFKILTRMCSEKLKCNPNKIRFKFDGELISITSTPNELDFEGGEIIDLLMSD